VNIAGLLHALDELSGIHEQLIGLAEEKQQLIVHNEVDRLMAATAKESKHIAEIERVNRDVQQFTRACWSEIGIVPNERTTLADLLAAIVQEDCKRPLHDAANRLRDAVGRLKQINDRNQQLVRQTLEYINFQVDLLSAPLDDGTYAPTPKPAASGTARRMFDTRA